MNSIQPDTVVAVSTPPGQGGIGIVRLSGPRAFSIADQLFRTRSGAPLSAAAPLRLSLGTIIDCRTGEPLDEALAVRMPVGRSYTGEPTVEFQTHAGRAVLEGVVGSALACGARLAAPGEFTRRAFLGGRLDLAQAEAVADLIAAESAEARRMALEQLQGRTGNAIRALRERLLHLVCEAEAVLDFSEEEGLLGGPDPAVVEAFAAEVRLLAAKGREGNIVREGVRVVIAGRTNAGKSSLFNELLHSPRSIVAASPGTTRDYVEERAMVEGVPMLLIDTAGIRSAGDAAEAEGIRRSRSLLGEADVVILLIDGSEPLDAPARDLLFDSVKRSPLVAITKIDLPQRLDAVALREELGGFDILELSVKEGRGLDRFRRSLADRCRQLLGSGGTPVAPLNRRHQAILERTATYLGNASLGMTSGRLSSDLVAIELRSALDCLGEITGETATEEILDAIFSRFCIGK